LIQRESILEEIMMILYANYIALGIRGLISNITQMKVKMGYYSDTIDIGVDEEFLPYRLSKDFMRDDSITRSDMVLKWKLGLKVEK